MSFFGQNIKKIRKIKQISQSQFADLFKLTRASIGAYEEGRSEAKVDTIIQIANHFSISVDSLLTKELTVNDLYHFDLVNKDLDKYHHIKENGTTASFTGIPLVSDKIFTEYLANIGNFDFINSLPKIKLPVDNPSHLRAFVQYGNAMQYNNSGIFHGDIVIVEQIEIDKLEADKLFIVITHNQVYLRRFETENNSSLAFKTDNFDYEAFQVQRNEIMELWMVKYIFTKHVSSSNKSSNRIDDLERRLRDIEERMSVKNKTE